MPNDELDEFELDLQDEDIKPEEDVVTIKKSDFKKLDRKARAYDADKAKPAPQSSKPHDTSLIDSKLARLELKYEGLSDEAIDFAMQHGGKESLKNPYVKAAIDAIQEQKRAENAVVSEDTSKSDIERKYTPEELNAMSPEEMYKILPKAKN